MKQLLLVYTLLIILIFILCKQIDGASIVTNSPNNKEKSTEKNTPISTSKLTANTSEMITALGYTARTYQVITEDGYILTLSRIVNSGPVVFLMHGLLNSADDWCTQSSKAFPFLLADKGYDVYLGNQRGNKYSMKHIKLSTKEKSFWNFSFHEIGYYDLPAMIDFALETSNKTKLVYVGHSQGTTAFYVMASLRTNYNDKISLMVSMATIAWLYHVKSPMLRLLTPLKYQEAFLTDVLRMYDILAYKPFWHIITTKVCPLNNFTKFVCASVLFTVFGFDFPQLNYTQFPIQIGHDPAGASIKQFLHYSQLIDSKKFRQFDYELPIKNQAAYKANNPPDYPVENVTVPVAIIAGLNDLLSVSEDVNILISKLPNVILYYTVPFKDFNHIDFLWAEDAYELVYKPSIELMESINDEK